MRFENDRAVVGNGELDSEDEEERERAKYLSKAISELIEAVKKIEIDKEKGEIRVSFVRR